MLISKDDFQKLYEGGRPEDSSESIQALTNAVIVLSDALAKYTTTNLIDAMEAKTALQVVWGPETDDRW